MSRICGLYRFDAAAHPGDGRAIDGALRTLPGQAVSMRSSQGTTLGRISFSNGDLNGGVAEADGWLVALDGALLNARTLSNDLQDHASVLISRLVRHGAERTWTDLDGDYSAMAYDIRANRCWLLRDRIGVKPLYWARIKGGIACASQPRALLALPDVDSAINTGFAARFAGMHYRTFDNHPEESPYAGIHQVPAGTAVEISASGQVRSHRYWALGNQPDWEDNEEVLAERYRALLMAAVEKREQQTRSPAFTLSGGLDSSSVLCCAATSSKAPKVAFSTIYRDPTYDERHEIKDVVGDKVSAWHPVELSDEIDLFTQVRKLVAMHDEPVATATWLSHNQVAEASAGAGRSSLFGGLGGDELNAGEYEYFPPFFADLAATNQDSLLAAEIDAWGRHHDHPIFRKNAATARELMSRVADPSTLGRCIPDQVRLKRYVEAVRPEFSNLRDFQPVMDGPFASYLKNRTYQDMFRETLPCCLRAEDRQCTAAGLAHSDPFLDHELVEFMYRVKGTMKIRHGVTKHLLRLAMRNILPEATRGRIAKVGWNAPAHVWFSGRNLENLRDLVSSRKFAERGIYVVPTVQRLIDEHVAIVQSGALKENHMMFLWQLINLELWLDLVPSRSVVGAS